MKQLVLTALLLLTIGVLFAGVAAADTVTDIDGNVYQTVIIGTQVWMAENLKVTHYSNGDTVPVVIADSAAWTGLTTGASCAYDNDANYVNTYGRIYNWYAVSDGRNVAPTGWHVPTDAEWKQVEVFLGMPVGQVDGTGYRGGSPVGGKLKEAGTSHWTCPNTGTTNETGFTGLPGGCLDNRPIFTEMGTSALFWTSSEFAVGSTAAWARNLTCNLPYIGRDGYAKDYGASVRCVRDDPADVDENYGGNLPDRFLLVQNYPNPFNPTTSIEYGVPTRSHVVLEIFNVLGQRVRTLVNETKSAGNHRVEWNGTTADGMPVSSGVYLYRIQAGKFAESKKMLLLK